MVVALAGCATQPSGEDAKDPAPATTGAPERWKTSYTRHLEWSSTEGKAPDGDLLVITIPTPNWTGSHVFLNTSITFAGEMAEGSAAKVEYIDRNGTVLPFFRKGAGWFASSHGYVRVSADADGGEQLVNQPVTGVDPLGLTPFEYSSSSFVYPERAARLNVTIAAIRITAWAVLHSDSGSHASAGITILTPGDEPTLQTPEEFTIEDGMVLLDTSDGAFGPEDGVRVQAGVWRKNMGVDIRHEFDAAPWWDVTLFAGVFDHQDEGMVLRSSIRGQTSIGGDVLDIDLSTDPNQKHSLTYYHSSQAPLRESTLDVRMDGAAWAMLNYSPYASSGRPG